MERERERETRGSEGRDWGRGLDEGSVLSKRITAISGDGLSCNQSEQPEEKKP